MEATFYDERPMKRPMTLDLGGSVNGHPSKRHHPNSALLSSPDLQLLKLASPELERFLLSQHQASNQPCMYNGKEDTQSQFDEVMPPHPMYNPPIDMGLGDYMYSSSAQQQLQMQQQHLNGPADTTGHNHDGSMNGSYQNQSQLSNGHHLMLGHFGGGGNGHFDNGMLMNIKEEPQTVPPSCPSSPIDLVRQEQMKLERKRLRNRIAASKCRRRKLEKIAKLEDKVARLKGENAELSNRVVMLKDTVSRLKTEVMRHVRGGCDLAVNSLHYGHDL